MVEQSNVRYLDDDEADAVVVVHGTHEPLDAVGEVGGDDRPRIVVHTRHGPGKRGGSKWGGRG